MALNPLYDKVDEINFKKWTPEKIAKWEQIRERGLGRYVLPYAVGGVALGIALVLAIGIAERWRVEWWILGIPFILVTLSVLRMGWSFWRNDERLYKKAIEIQNAEKAKGN